MIEHQFAVTTEIKGAKRNRKIITYRCTNRGCDAKGRISTIPSYAADALFEVVRADNCLGVSA